MSLLRPRLMLHAVLLKSLLWWPAGTFCVEARRVAGARLAAHWVKSRRARSIRHNDCMTPAAAACAGAQLTLLLAGLQREHGEISNVLIEYNLARLLTASTTTARNGASLKFVRRGRNTERQESASLSVRGPGCFAQRAGTVQDGAGAAPPREYPRLFLAIVRWSLQAVEAAPAWLQGLTPPAAHAFKLANAGVSTARSARALNVPPRHRNC